jgi:hypothetical protein
MRLTGHTAPAVTIARLAACGALGIAALSGCGLLPSFSDTTPAASPTHHRTHPAATTSATASSSGASESPSVVASTSAAPSAAASATSVAVTRYTDKTSLLQLPVAKSALPDAPAGLVPFASDRLEQMWHDQFQGDPGCEGIAQVRIKRTIPTQAYVEASWGDLTPTCPQYAGNPGWWEVWRADGSGTWSVALKGEGTAACTDLVSAAIPRSIYPSCSDGSKKVPNPVG